VSSNYLRDEGATAIFRALQQNRSVVHLKIGSSTGLARNYLGRQAVVEIRAMLASNEVLSSLDLSMSEISSDNVEQIAEGLAENRTLQSLDITGNDIRTKGAASLLSKILRSRLNHLCLSSDHITDDLGPYLAKFLTTNTSLKSLDLSGNSFSQRFISAICVPLAGTSVLEELNLSKNPLGGRGIAGLGTALTTNVHLKRLDLSACKIPVAGFSEFCTALSRNTTLEVFACQYNPIRDEGAIRLARVLNEWTAIRQLDLELCEIGDPGAKALFAAVEVSRTLQKISIKTNLIRNGLPLVQTLSNNPKIVVLRIEYNDIEYKTYTEIQRLVGLNYRRWKGRQKTRTAEETQQLINIDEQLHTTRKLVVAQRAEIADLTQQFHDRKEEFKCAEVDRAAKQMILEQRQNEIEIQSSELTEEIRRQNEDARSALSNQEFEVRQLSLELARDTETSAVMSRNLALLEAELQKRKKDFEAQIHELLVQLKEVKLRYRDAKAMLVGQFEQVKEEQALAAAEAKRQEEQATMEEEKKWTRGKSSPKKKRKTKATVKGSEEVPQNNARKLAIEASGSFSQMEEANAEGEAEGAE
jgi:Ran GTPase-activating protein (RanGAP) involved in mRNA processing and transport